MGCKATKSVSVDLSVQEPSSLKSISVEHQDNPVAAAEPAPRLLGQEATLQAWTQPNSKIEKPKTTTLDPWLQWEIHLRHKQIERSRSRQQRNGVGPPKKAWGIKKGRDKAKFAPCGVMPSESCLSKSRSL
eukprot:gnl/MRDRNA2_/MRDRNA2_87958_c0_seq1.p1 gnl/MRDRNA2_/MRDRNA2_87958_c0~~gnl/MRDRNA2_/MRDRNA2_87958_c0_seq1.p1  ORF type:complete len:131 (+),score=21.10 gnl/MRDRNA2_/MRDRNA2_87958_c0_seq1:85-477(+)